MESMLEETNATNQWTTWMTVEENVFVFDAAIQARRPAVLGVMLAVIFSHQKAAQWSPCHYKCSPGSGFSSHWYTIFLGTTRQVTNFRACLPQLARNPYGIVAQLSQDSYLLLPLTSCSSSCCRASTLPCFTSHRSVVVLLLRITPSATTLGHFSLILWMKSPEPSNQTDESSMEVYWKKRILRAMGGFCYCERTLRRPSILEYQCFTSYIASICWEKQSWSTKEWSQVIEAS